MVERLFNLTKGESDALDSLAASQNTTPEHIILQALAQQYLRFGEEVALLAHMLKHFLERFRKKKIFWSWFRKNFS